MKIARIFGIDIVVRFSFMALLVFLAAFYSSYFTSVEPVFNWKISIAGAIIMALLFAFSLLFHEMAHGLMAKREGVQTEKISFMLFGAIAQFVNVLLFFEKPSREFKIIIVGPLSSLFLAGVFFAASNYIGEPSIVHQIFKNLAVINLIFAVFNSIPCFPLDGGRILRSIIWKIRGNLSRATSQAVFISLIFWLLIIVGSGIFYDVFLAIWIALIAITLIMPAAFKELKSVMFMEKYRNVLVREVMKASVMHSLTKQDFELFKYRPTCSPEDKVLAVMEKHPTGRLIFVIDRNMVLGTLDLADLFV